MAGPDRFKFKRGKTAKILDQLEESDPEAHAAIMELRRHNPQAYRKRLVSMALGMLLALTRLEVFYGQRSRGIWTSWWSRQGSGRLSFLIR